MSNRAFGIPLSHILLLNQFSALLFFIGSIKHALGTIQLYFNSKELPVSWGVSRTSVILKGAALACAAAGLCVYNARVWRSFSLCTTTSCLIAGFPLATLLHPTVQGSNFQSKPYTAGLSQWSMVAALILYYMTFSYDIYVVLAATGDSGGIGRHTDGADDKEQKEQSKKAK